MNVTPIPQPVTENITLLPCQINHNIFHESAKKILFDFNLMERKLI